MLIFSFHASSHNFSFTELHTVIATKAQDNPVKMATLPMKMDSAFDKMRGSLSRYARSNDRRMVLRSMREVKYLACLPLEPVQLDVAAVPSLEAELETESIILNGITFHAHRDFLRTLYDLCLQFCEMDGVSINPRYLYEGLVVRMARSTAAADSHFKLNSVMGSSDLMIMSVPMKKVPHPIELNLFVSKGDVHAQVSTVNSYGLFRKSDVKPSETNQSGRPWISIQAVVDERVNFSNGQSVRNLRVKLPDLY